MTQVLIIGAGLNGLSCAYAAWKQGHQVTVIEQFSLGHTLGSSHGESRIIRYSYGHPEYVRLAKRAYPLWHELEDQLELKIIHPVGGIDLAPSGHPVLQQHMNALQTENIDFELLSGPEASERFPQFHLPDSESVLFQKDAGILKPDEVLPALARFLRKQGVSIQENTPVLSAEHGKVVTERWTYQPDHVLVCAGAWVNRLLPAPLPLQVTEEQLSYFAVPDQKFHYPNMPVFIDLVRGPYGFPQLDRPGVKLGLHHHGPTVTPENRTFAHQPDKTRYLADWMARFMPEVSATPLENITCLYTNTPDEDFVVDRMGDHLTVVSACSGHGFKFGPATGELALQRALQTPDAFSGFFLADFQQE
ncbi:N-methyl-L-tryptophan oxidase [Deinococcus roseus]|uniref:N-methyltryptophan oxidase n=1 Tax=Deinococcus roseus TaxID=392414 RepID=A0ABQ2D5H4_9DEIO|nr:N-methyl-L-tryptophan oxidase [Deinococcus roseus]GGJ41749.1 N-methyltryptophan oxidase [Deinococcus roseus]